MSVILTFVKNYFIFMLLLFLFSFLAPKKEYKKYIQFFIGVYMVAVLLHPVLNWIQEDERKEIKKELQEIEKQVDGIEFEEEGKDIYERFLEAYEENQKLSVGTE